MPPLDHDELARRRRGTAAGFSNFAARDGANGPHDEKPPHFSWTDILAMIIAAYQIILPVLFLFIGVIVVAYLLFRFAFA